MESSPIMFGSKEHVTEGELSLKMKLGLVMSSKIYDQMITYIRAIDFECSGLGHIALEDGVLTLKEISLPKQTGTNGGTELDADAVSSMMTQQIKNGDLKAQNFWWHSHVNMETFWSGIDDDNCSRLSDGNGFLVSIVGVQSGRMRCRFDISKPFRLTIDEIPIYITNPLTNGAQVKAWKEQISKNVRQTAPLAIPPADWSHNGQMWDTKDLYSRTKSIYAGQLSTAKYPLIPRPHKAIRLTGAITEIAQSEQNDYTESLHTIWCHTFKTSVECEECVLYGCFSCQYNASKVGSETATSPIWRY